MTLVRLDDLFRRANSGRMLDLPAGIGFCLLIRRACLDAVGQFDTFVYHEGGASFGAERRQCAHAGALRERLLERAYRLAIGLQSQARTLQSRP